VLAHGRFSLEDCIQAWGPQHEKEAELQERLWKRGTEIIKGQEHISCEEKLREVGMFCLEMRRHQRNPTAAFLYLLTAERLRLYVD